MATRYLLFPTLDDAVTENTLFWDRILGIAARDKSVVEDDPNLTRRLCASMTDPNTRETMLIMDDGSYVMLYPKLSTDEQQNLDASLVDETDPRVIAILAAQPKPVTPGAR